MYMEILVFESYTKRAVCGFHENFKSRDFRYIKQLFFFFQRCCDLTRVMASSFLRFLDHTQRRTTVGRTPLDE